MSELLSNLSDCLIEYRKNKLNNDFFVKIENDIWDNENLSNEDLTIYAFIKRYQTVRGYCIVNVNQLFIDLKLNKRTMLKTIRDSIIHLQDNDLIICCDAEFNMINKTELETIKYSDSIIIVVQMLNSGFFSVYDKDVELIINHCIKSKTNRFALIRYYIALCRVTNSNINKQIGFLSQRKASFICSRKDIIEKYNNILRELNIFYHSENYVNELSYRYMVTYFGRTNEMTEDEFKTIISSIAKEAGYTLDKSKLMV